MITQTLAMLLDAYRELNARKLFWITMVLSGLVVAVFGAVGIDEEGVSFLWFKIGFIPVNTDIVSREVFYKGLFTNLGIGIWLTWVAAILALVSTASIIPDMISGGSIETMLSKPIGRVRLFLTKYTMALLFVCLQVGVFTVASFLVIGFRGGGWEIGLFLAIPIVVAFFSFLYCVCAYLGLVTRSTIAALLLTMLFWASIFVVNAGDAMVIQFRESTRIYVEQRESRIERARKNTVLLINADRRIADLPDEGYEPTDDEIVAKNPFYQGQLDALVQDKKELASLETWSKIVIGMKTVLPKTGETAALLERHLIDLDEIAPSSDDAPDLGDLDDEIEVDQSDLSRRVQEVYRSRSVSWVLGTSLAFEAFFLAICCLIFRRRDF